MSENSGRIGVEYDIEHTVFAVYSSRIPSLKSGFSPFIPWADWTEVGYR
ncbi:hypothetical protein [Allocoleopsis franciscana]|nr:hypothetical protein [Allocoleopsis franciscana]